MKRRFTKIGGIIFTIVFIAVLFVPVQPAKAASSDPISFSVIKEYKSKVYATSTFCVSGWKLIKNAASFCIYNGNVYYLTTVEASAGYEQMLYSLKLNGSGKKLLAKFCGGGAYLKGSKIYYDGAANSEGKYHGIYCYDLTKKTRKLLVKNAYLVECDSKNIYYRNEKGLLYKCNYSGSGKSAYITAQGYDSGLFYKDYYYTISTDEGDFFRTEKANPTRFERITTNAAQSWHSFLIHDDYIYYSVGKSMYKCKVDGTEIKKLCSLQSKGYGGDAVKVVGPYLYFIDNYESGSNNCFLYRVSINGGSKKFMNKKWFMS